jgi:DNA-directed RNA polymerase specialized sigma24 family protein
MTDGDSSSVRYAYGRASKRLSREEEKTASFEDRFHSVLPWLATQCTNHLTTLRDRERAATSVDDLLLEAWIVLRRKDAKWRPATGKYMTFATLVVRRMMIDTRCKLGVVPGPVNSWFLLKKIQGKEAPTPREAESARKILATSHVYGITQGQESGDDEEGRVSLGHCDHSCTPDGAVSNRESVAEVREVIKELIVRLNPMEALVVGWGFGLWNVGPYSDNEIAEKIKCSPKKIVRLRISALEKMRDHGLGTVNT